MNAIVKTDFHFPGQKSVYKGKVRDVYDINDEYLVMVVSDRISAFDVVLPEGIPYKGQVLNQIASKFLDATADIVPNCCLQKLTHPQRSRDTRSRLNRFSTPPLHRKRYPPYCDARCAPLFRPASYSTCWKSWREIPGFLQSPSIFSC